MDNSQKYERALNNLLTLAIADLHGFIDRLDYSKPYECKRATLEFMRYLGNKYAVAAQELARLAYIEARGGTQDGFNVEYYSGIDAEDFMNSVNYYCKFLFGEQVENGE